MAFPPMLYDCIAALTDPAQLTQNYTRTGCIEDGARATMYHGAGKETGGLPANLT